MASIVVIYNKKNHLKMSNIHSSLTYHNEDIDLRCKPNEDHKIVVTDTFMFFGRKAVLVISEWNKKLKGLKNAKDIILIQYESFLIKKKMEKAYPFLCNIKSVIINAIPRQLSKITPTSDQSSTIFYQGKDKPEDMVDLMFDLDMKTHYVIMFYNDKSKLIPSKRHKLSWCVSKNKNNIGIISYKIITEIMNGCLPILIKEYMPKSFFAYPFCISLKELEEKDSLIKRVKEIGAFISKMKRDDFASLANAIYNGIYIESKWKYNYFLISEEIKGYID